MEKLIRWLEKVYDRRITQEFDLLCPVVGDEGKGKSTLMLELTWLYQDIRGLDPAPESVLDRVVWDQDGFKTALADWEPRSAITVQDAARVLHKREAMQPDQIETEKDLLDVRTKEFLILLGFQDWDIIPTSLQTRRAKAALYIPRRGRVWGYSRSTLDKRVDDDDWPDPDLVDTFPALDETRLWDEFQAADREHKEGRIRGDDAEDNDEPEWEPHEVVEDILDGSVAGYVSENEFNGTVYIDTDLIQYDYDLSVRGAKQVKKAVTRAVDVESYVTEGAAEGEAHTS